MTRRSRRLLLVRRRRRRRRRRRPRSSSACARTRPTTRRRRSPAKPALSVVVTQPQRATLPVSTRANGNIAAWQEASIGTEANGLRLAEVRVNVGDVVKRGQVLATFAPESMQVDLLQTRAAVAEAEATLGDAAANAERAQGAARDRRAERSDDQPVRHRRAHRARPPRRAARGAAGAPDPGRPDRRASRPTPASSRRAARRSAPSCRPARSCFA